VADWVLFEYFSSVNITVFTKLEKLHSDNTAACLTVPSRCVYRWRHTEVYAKRSAAEPGQIRGTHHRDSKVVTGSSICNVGDCRWSLVYTVTFWPWTVVVNFSSHETYLQPMRWPNYIQKWVTCFPAEGDNYHKIWSWLDHPLPTYDAFILPIRYIILWPYDLERSS